ncbi:MAG: c-type cytochrome [Gallionella sp.]|nr:c-type cytochrome [Gallionella sp.]MDP1941981.1 c-type cytochrome [Gallionella sp.]
MKTIIVSIIAAIGLMMAGVSIAVDMPDVAKKNNCTSCHAIDKKVVGPGWQDVADKYKGDAGAAEKLSTVIVKGGRGVWGPMPMPATSKITDAEVSEIVAFIQGLAK